MSLQTPVTNIINGTILATGTLSSEFNLQGYGIAGLILETSSVNGTMGFMVSDRTDTAPGASAPPNTTPGVYRTLNTSGGVPVAFTAASGQSAIDSSVFAPVKGYQYIRITSTAQTTGLALKLILKSE